MCQHCTKLLSPLPSVQKGSPQAWDTSIRLTTCTPGQATAAWANRVLGLLAGLPCLIHGFQSMGCSLLLPLLPQCAFCAQPCITQAC